jgi:CPA2 family monovalent cation:H+ antiporter-2
LTFRVAVLAAAALSQIGEFSFILISAARGTGLLPVGLENNLIAVAILTMLITPFGLAAGPHLAAGVGRLRILGRLIRVSTAEEAAAETKGMTDHIIIGGYGYAGQQLAASLKKCNIPFIVIELNIENVRQARKNRDPAFFGDITSQEVLELVGIGRAREIVIVINDPSATERVVRAVRALAPTIHIVARTTYLQDIELLRRAGADQVIPAEREAAVKVASYILERHQIDPGVIDEQCHCIRQQDE